LYSNVTRKLGACTTLRENNKINELKLSFCICVEEERKAEKERLFLTREL